ncbi:methyltransferase domain-containing protein [Candidatus Woesearchaeota archaeon]|nr:methyltransferase domain-containing protein [Candidatus Woesearchaeota archaeon]
MWKQIDGYSLEKWKDIKLHEWILQDQIRNTAFKAALEEVVQNSDVVLDLGFGLGYLSSLALESGASRVYGIEYHQNIIEEAKRRVTNAKVRFLLGKSTELSTNSLEPVDVIVSETLGFMGVGENIVKYVADARKKWLKDYGKIIPAEIELYLSPVFVPKSSSASQVMCEIKPEYLVGEPQMLAKFDLYSDDEVLIDKDLTFRLRGAKINGFAGWFKAKLSENVTLDTSPFKPQTCWHQMLYPIGNMQEESVKTNVASYEKNGLILLRVTPDSLK